MGSDEHRGLQRLVGRRARAAIALAALVVAAGCGSDPVGSGRFDASAVDATPTTPRFDVSSTAQGDDSTTVPYDSTVDVAPSLPFPFPIAADVTTRVATEFVGGPDREFVLRVTITNETGSTVETPRGLLINPSSPSTWDGALRVGATTADDPSLIWGPNCDSVDLVLLRIDAGNSVTLSTRLSALEPGAEYRVALMGIRFVATDGTATYANVIDTFRSPG